LYELLTSRPPFRSADPVETLRQVRDEEPLSPRRLNRAVHRDLELICLKCLEKDPRKRYANAHEMADELRRYQRGDPLRATRPVGVGERAWRWCWRRPALAAVSGLALAAALAAVAVSVCFALYQSRVVHGQQQQLAELTFENATLRCKE